LKIVDVRAIPVTVPQKGELSGYLPHQEDLRPLIRKAWTSCFVEIETDDGLTGTGESVVREVPRATALIIEELLKPVIMGKDPADIDVLWELMYATLRTRGHSRGYFIEALSGVDIALWDLLGRAQGKPVYKLLGGAWDLKVKAYASSILFGKPDEMAREALKLVEAGHDQIKMKVGMGERKDEENVRAVRETVGYDVGLMVDANSAYNAPQAIRLGRKFERYECLWFEEPVPPDDINGYIEVARALDIPIAGGESHFLRYDFRELIARNAIDIVMPDVGRAGGISECRKIASIASIFGKQYTPHVGLSGAGVRAASLHLSASIPRETFLSYEYYHIPGRPNPLANEITKRPIEVFKDGYVDVPSTPGLGIELKHSVVKGYRVKNH
jgi:D-arabinonate dehydratase/D-galactarolactone cycloisomerase